MEKVFQLIGAIVVAGGGIIGIAYGLFRFLGEKWLEAKFAERLADYKHKHQQELEQLRFKINSMFDRKTKFHQREFEVLPEAWGYLVEAFHRSEGFLSPLQTYPDLDRMKPAHLEEFIRNCELPDWQKDEMRSEQQKTDYYSKKIFWHRLSDVQKTLRESYVYLRRNGIFLPPEIQKKFAVLDDILWNAVQEREFNEKYPDARPLKTPKQDRLSGEGKKLLAELEKDVQGRLWSAEEGA